MSDPWFDPAWAFLPGTLLGGVGGPLIGVLAALFAARGRARALVLGVNGLLTLSGLVSLALGVIALASGQPYGVWYGLTLAGVLGTLLFGAAFFILGSRYRHAERRRMEARDL